jgi:branched-subunit amino acid aminotransferase/4-amino-4-deoxychorismate lyase
VHARIILNNRLVEASKARLRAVTSATLYGRGVFTTLAVYGGRPFLWDEHWERLSNHAARAGVGFGFRMEEAKSALARLLESNGVERGRARITVLARDAGGPWRTADEGKAADEGEATRKGGATREGEATRESDILMMTGDASVPREETLALTVSPYRLNTLSPLSGVKSVNYLERILSWEEARGRDFDEALVLNERGEVVSATLANIFWVKHGTLHTPALQTGALAGTTRARVIEMAAGMAVPIVEGAGDLRDLGDADEIFLTSAGLGLTLVTTFDFHRYTIGLGSVALRLREAFRQLTLAAG